MTDLGKVVFYVLQIRILPKYYLGKFSRSRMKTIGAARLKVMLQGSNFCVPRKNTNFTQMVSCNIPVVNFVALKVVVRNRPVGHHLEGGFPLSRKFLRVLLWYPY